jgi:receptor protein-tyrosine kinase
MKPDCLILAQDPQHPRSEVVRALRTRLLLTRDNSAQSGTFVVLSARPGEGRSILCAELAVAFAQLERRTLIVDADLRHPWQHALFSGPNLVGLAQALHRDEVPRIHGIEGIPHLALLTSGGTPPNPLELLSSDRLERLIRAWQREYEFIVIDTPPIGLYSDGLAIASAAGRALIATRAHATSFADLKELTRQLAVAPLRILGAVINRF